MYSTVSDSVVRWVTFAGFGAICSACLADGFRSHYAVFVYGGRHDFGGGFRIEAV